MNERAIKKIYDALGDQESKQIFNHRLLFSLTGDYGFIETMAEDYKKNLMLNQKLKGFIERLKSLGNTYYIFGVGAYGRFLSEVPGSVSWKGFIDNRPQIKEYHGLPVYSFRDFLDRHCGEFVVLPSKKYFCEMKKQLMENGIPECLILEGEVLHEITEGSQYFDMPYFKAEEDEIFIDGGCYDGMSSAQFMEWAGERARFVYCFEPDRMNVDKIKQFFSSSNIKNYKLIQKGLWDKREILSFMEKGTVGSRISEDEKSKTVDAQIETTSLDWELEGEKITFIKLDIEGAELPALLGSQRIITEQKPKLAVCVYHKLEDIWKIPEFILSLRPDYRLYLRHYSFGSSDTVLYAV